MPRKTKLTPETHKAIVDALSVGATHRIACEYAGIHQDTFYFWLEKGREGKSPYSEFSEAVTRAQGRAAVGWLAKIEAAGADDWRALAFKLERRWPEEFGRTVQEHHGPQGGPVQIEVVYTAPPKMVTPAPALRALPEQVQILYDDAPNGTHEGRKEDKH